MGYEFKAPGFVRLRNGTKAYAYGIDPFQKDTMVVGIKGETFAAYADGRQYKGDKEHAHDVMEDWVEPKRIKGWQNIYINPHGVTVTDCFFNSSRKAADELADMSHSRRIACIEIDVLEGQGLDGSANNG